MKTIKVLSLPSRHPYMSKFNTGQIEFVNPNSDFFSEGKCEISYLNNHFSPSSYDIVHIHFSFDKISVEQLEIILKYFKKNKKPIIWTCHSKESQRIKNYGDGKYQQLLFSYSNQIISPTQGCADWIISKFGQHKRQIEIIPLGFMADPSKVQKLHVKVKKDKNLYTMLIGDFRKNKEFLQPIINFLECSVLKKARLQLIFKPINVYINEYDLINQKMIIFHHLIQNPRITTLSLPNIPNDLLTMAFLKSHAIIMWYKWGTHSGQIELAKDCGCHAVASNVGFYHEQWDKAYLWEALDDKLSEFPNRFTDALIQVHQKKSLKPAGNWRKEEFRNIFQKHLKIYENLLNRGGVV